MECFVGVDVGFTGGIAALLDGAPLPLLFPMPTVKYNVKRRRDGATKDGVDTELATSRLVVIFEELKQHNPYVLIEKPQIMPGQGVVSQAKFWGQFTEIRGVLVTLRIPFEDVHPATWKADIFRGQGRASDDESQKEKSRLRAINGYPLLAERLNAKNTHGLAEALLIAEYLKRRRGAPF